MITDLGYIGLCFDTWVFGERAHTPEQDMFKAMLWQDRVLWGMMVYDSIKAVDYLVSRDDVDASRIATLGISMGSTMAWWLAALDERIAVTVDICCLTDLHTFLQKDTLGGHGIYYYVPGLLNYFSTSDINALIAPRAHLALAGLQDKLTPPEGLDIVDVNLQQVYAACGKPENWKLLRLRCGPSGNTRRPQRNYCVFAEALGVGFFDSDFDRDSDSDLRIAIGIAIAIETPAFVYSFIFLHAISPTTQFGKHGLLFDSILFFVHCFLLHLGTAQK